MNKLSIDDLDLKNKKVLVRVDFNVPIEKGKITDDTRIYASLPTIKKILSDQGKAIIISHLGRPKGKQPEFTLKPVAQRLSQLLGREVKFVEDCIGPEVEKAIEQIKFGECILLENLRFYPEEEKNDSAFAQKLASLANLFVNDAFGTAHRAHASTAGVTQFFKHNAAGYLMQKEIYYLSMILSNPKKPFLTILGGAKVSDKINVIENLISQKNVNLDGLLIGGGMAFTFIKALGGEIGESMFEKESLETTKNIFELAKIKNIRIMLPEDCAVEEENHSKSIQNSFRIPAGAKGLDIGPKTLEKFSQAINSAKTILWNGPLGVFEREEFALGSIQMAHRLAYATSNGAVTVIGGGDTIAVINQAKVADKLTHISTGGGASLEFLEGKELPGIKTLSDK
ncbi:MAG: phosphoglycerate kinase [candidate division Zixibacteria bacterium RBG_16_40_9]|nr:MAG: phosphoglycerate kinase [candidate division Zixibacteria bacterium RBG_16_40_9]